MIKEKKVLKGALEGLAKSMAQLQLDKLRGYKKMPGSDDEDEDEDGEMVKVLEARKQDK